MPSHKTKLKVKPALLSDVFSLHFTSITHLFRYIILQLCTNDCIINYSLNQQKILAKQILPVTIYQASCA